MSTYRRYQEARDTAWRALLRLPEASLPVDVDHLAQALGVDVLPFPDETENPRVRALIAQTGAVRCVSLRIRGHWYVFIRHLDERERRFAVAHELGHLLLRHPTRPLAPGVRAFAGGENAGDLLEDPIDPADYAADIFAVRLLAPACVLHDLHIDSPAAIGAVCGLPPRAAALRAERMELLNARNAYFTHPLERQVRDRFLPFVRARAFPAAVPSPAPAPPADTAPRAGLPQPVPPAVAPRRRLWILLAAAAAVLGIGALFFVWIAR